MRYNVHYRNIHLIMGIFGFDEFSQSELMHMVWTSTSKALLSPLLVTPPCASPGNLQHQRLILWRPVLRVHSVACQITAKPGSLPGCSFSWPSIFPTPPAPHSVIITFTSICLVQNLEGMEGNGRLKEIDVPRVLKISAGRGCDCKVVCTNNQ